MTSLVAEALAVRYGSGRDALTAVDRASLIVQHGQTHGLVGESGSGKSSLARGLVGLAPAASGRVLLDGADVTNANGAAARTLRHGVQLVFQNPRASLNPRMTVGDIIGEAILVQQPSVPVDERQRTVAALLDLVGLGIAAAERFPHQLSGGQGQRVAIARALATGARIIILDEVTSALDVSVQANILNLLRRLQRERGLGYGVGPDLSAVKPGAKGKGNANADSSSPPLKLGAKGKADAVSTSPPLSPGTKGNADVGTQKPAANTHEVPICSSRMISPSFAT